MSLFKNQIHSLPITRNDLNLGFHTLNLKKLNIKTLNQLNNIDVMTKFSIPNCNIFMEECLTIQKKICDKCVTLIIKKLYIHGDFWYKTKYHQFLPINSGRTVGCKVYTVTMNFTTLRVKKLLGFLCTTGITLNLKISST